MRARYEPIAPVKSGVWRRDGEVWVVGLGDRRTSLRDSKGMRHLAVLLERPGEAISALDLVSAVEGLGARTEPAPDSELSIGGLGDAGELLDAQARSEYRRRLEEARAEAEEAERFNDPERAARARLEVEFLARELAAAVGLGGRERRAGSATERARVNVTRLIKAAIDRIAEHDEDLGSHLRLAVRTGTYCSYDPPSDLAVRWVFEGEPTTSTAAPTVPELTEAPRPKPDDRRPIESDLVERQAELERIDAAVGEAAAGAGSLVVLHGPAGIGKSSLLAEATGRAAAAGFTVAHARGGLLERASAFGVARQLFDPLVSGLPDTVLETMRSGAVRPALAMLGYVDDASGPVSGDAGPADIFPIINGLHWLATALSQRAPVALVVDDVHHADDASLTWLEFMAARVSIEPVLLVLATRSLTRRSPPVLETLVHSSAANRIDVAPLTKRGVAELVRITYPEATDEFCTACWTATAGNPFYVRQLVASARAAGVPPDHTGAERLPDITPQTVTRLVLARFDDMSDSARTLARACAVLDAPSDLALAAGVAEIDDGTALEAVDALAAAGVVEPSWPVRFTHPLIATAVNRDLPLGERTVLHERAARLLGDRGAPPTEIAKHLLHARPAGSQETVACLCAAAREAVRHATPAAAVRLLERALAEPASRERAAQILLELARARRDTGDQGIALSDLERALELTTDPRLRAELILELARHEGLETSAAIGQIDAAIEQLGQADRELRFRLEAKAIDLLNFAAWQSTSADARRLHDERLSRVVAEADGDSPSERQLLGTYSATCAVRAEIPASDAKALALRALDGGMLMRRLAEGVEECDAAIETLAMVDAFDLADRHAREAERHARELGGVGAAAYIAMLRAILAWHRGALLEAEALLPSILAAARQVGHHYVAYVAQQIRACVAIELGDLEAAERACDEISQEGVSPIAAPQLRGRLHVARGEHALAVPELRAAFDLNCSVGRWRTVVMGSPRADLALSLVAVGNGEEALALAEEEHAAALRFGAPSSLAAALRALGHAEGAEGIRRFEEAVAVLAESQAALARAQALCDLGTAQRVAGDLLPARRTLRQALELCDHISARRLGARVRAELTAAGGRPGRMSPRAVELLSPSERRVATLAAEGAGELEIAQALFLDVSDAKALLASALAKLEVDSPEHLAEAMLAAEPVS